MQVTKNITLDLLETGSPVIIKAKQNDRNTRYITAHLYVDGLAYPVPSGIEIAVRYKKPDGTAGFYDALPDNSPAITVSGNTVTVELVEQALTVAGCVHCEINMYNATSEKLTTFTFEIAVEKSVLTDAEIISSDYYNVLTAEISKALQAVTDATEQAENAAQSAQDAADSAAMSKDWAAGKPVTYSDTPVSIAYAGAQRIASITAYGENAQGGTTEAPVALTGVDSVQVCGKNMLPNKAKTNTVAGITFTVNPDKSVTAKGTATSWANIVIDADFSLPAGTYTLNSNIQTAGVNLVIGKDTSGKKNIAVSSTASKTFTLSDSIKHCVAYIAVVPDSVVDTTIRPMLNLGKTAMPYEPYKGNVTQLPIPRPLHKVGDVKDKCVTRQDYESAEKLVVTYNVGFVELDGTEDVVFDTYGNTQKRIRFDLDRNAIARYALKFSHGNPGDTPTVTGGISASFNRDVLNRLQIICSPDTWTALGVTDTATAKTWLAAQKEAGTPVQIAYQLATPETYATDPLDIDNAAGPLTVMTGGEVEVRMTELVGTRSDVSNNTVAFTETAQDADIASGEKLSVLFGKIKKRFSVVNKLVNGAVYPNLGTNTNFPNPVNQRGKTTYTGDSTALYCIDRWRISNSTTYNVSSFTLTAPSYAARACGMWQTNEMGAHQLSIGDDVTVSIYANGKLYTPTMKVIDRGLYDAFTNVPAGYDCDDFEIVLCTYAGNNTVYNLGIYPKKPLTVNYIKWEKGSVATPYVPKDYGAELAECKRYFNAFAIEVMPAYFIDGNIHYLPAVLFPARMRVVPTIEIMSAGVGNVGVVAASAVTIPMDANGIREIIVNAGTSVYDMYNKLTLDMRLSADY